MSSSGSSTPSSGGARKPLSELSHSELVAKCHGLLSIAQKSKAAKDGKSSGKDYKGSLSTYDLVCACWEFIVIIEGKVIRVLKGFLSFPFLLQFRFPNFSLQSLSSRPQTRIRSTRHAPDRHFFSYV